MKETKVDEAVEEADERALVWSRQLFYYLGEEEKKQKNMEYNEGTFDECGLILVMP